MDGLFPSSTCITQPVRCENGNFISYTGGTWVSSSYIRGRGQPTEVGFDWQQGWPKELTNNPPAAQIFVRMLPSAQDPSKLVFWLNGWERPRLFLKRGKKYQVNINTCGFPFYFTYDPHGGNGDKDNVYGVVPTDFFTKTYAIKEDAPSKFYYQCSLHPDIGGEVIVI